MSNGMNDSMANKLKRMMRTSGNGNSSISVKSIVAFVVFGAIVAVFALFGLNNSQMGGSAGGYAAVVNGSLITLSDYKSQLSRLEQMWAPILNMPGADSQRQELRATALNLLISSEVVSQSAQDLGVLVSDQEIRQVITQDIKEFQENNRFNKERYFALLEANGLNPTDFEARIRKDIQARRAEKLVNEALVESTFEKQKAQKLRDTRLNLAIGQLSKTQFAKNYTVSQEELASNLANEAFQKDIKNYFDTNKDEFTQKEQIHAQHILVKSDGSADADTKALAKIKAAQERLKKESFEAVAKAVSEDAGSQAKGGDLGFFERGRMVAPFEDAAFSQTVGRVGEPVKTAFGYHLIKVLEKKAAKDADFEALKPTIAKRIVGERAFDKAVAGLEEAVKAEKYAEVDQKLRELGGTWKETGYFSLAEQNIPQVNSPLVLSAVSELSKSQRWLKRVIREGDDRFFLKLVDSKIENTPGPLVAEGTLAKDVFRTWADKRMKESTIERNEQILVQ